MKFKYFFPLLLAFAFVTCDNDIDITTESKDITVVYGLLDPEADTNFVLIQRGYLGDEPAAASFSETDSFYYSSLDVSMNWYNLENKNLVGTTNLEVDFTSRKLNDNGPFNIQDGHRLYRIPTTVPINENFDYELIIKKPNGEITTARTSTVEPYSITAPIPNGTPPKFSAQVRFLNRADNISFYQVFVHFNYFEFNRVTKEEVHKTISLDFGETVQTNARDYELTMSLQNFFDRIAVRIEDDGSADVYRIFEDLKIEIYGADDILLTYMNLNTPATGINQNRPDFTNVENGIGIFASRSRKVLEGVDFNDQGSSPVKDLLLFNENMCPLKFIRFEGPDSCICNDPVTLNKICL